MVQVVDEMFLRVNASPTVPAAIFGEAWSATICEAVHRVVAVDTPVPLEVDGVLVLVVVGVCDGPWPFRVLLEGKVEVVTLRFGCTRLPCRAGRRKYAVAPAAMRATSTTIMLVPRTLPLESCLYLVMIWHLEKFTTSIIAGGARKNRHRCTVSCLVSGILNVPFHFIQSPSAVDVSSGSTYHL